MPDMNAASDVANPASANVVVRPATHADVAPVEALLRDASLPTDGIADHFEDGFVIAEINGALVGTAGLEIYGADGLLRSVVVGADRRGHRVGEALVRERLEWARTHEIRSVYLLTTTAAAFFTRLGFTIITRDEVPPSIQRSPEFAEICPSTATVMTKAVRDA